MRLITKPADFQEVLKKNVFKNFEFSVSEAMNEWRDKDVILSEIRLYKERLLSIGEYQEDLRKLMLTSYCNYW